MMGAQIIYAVYFLKTNYEGDAMVEGRKKKTFKVTDQKVGIQKLLQICHCLRTVSGTGEISRCPLSWKGLIAKHSYFFSAVHSHFPQGLGGLTVLVFKQLP